jgi:hypothetical protein
MPLTPSVEKTVNLLDGFEYVYKPRNRNAVFCQCGSYSVWQCILPEVIAKGFKKCCISSAGNGTDGDMLWDGSERGGNVRIEHKEDEGMTVMMQTVTLICKGW